jgi:hypothetical protein
VPNCTAAQIEFPAFKRRKIQAQFSGGAITSDGSVLLLRTIDQQLQLTQRIAEQMHDPRESERIRGSTCCDNGFMAWLAVMRI